MTDRKSQIGKTLVFDLGGVLVENDMFAELARLTGNTRGETELKSQWLASPAARAFELGQCSPEVFANEIINEFSLALTPPTFLAAFAVWPKGLQADAQQLLTALRRQYRVACLSNSNQVHWTKDIETHFDHAYSSHLLHRIKPDPEVFQFITTDLDCQPDDIVFFDDAAENIDAAREFGWIAHQTEGLQAVRAVLTAEALIE